MFDTMGSGSMPASRIRARRAVTMRGLLAVLLPLQICLASPQGQLARAARRSVMSGLEDGSGGGVTQSVRKHPYLRHRRANVFDHLGGDAIIEGQKGYCGSVNPDKDCNGKKKQKNRDDDDDDSRSRTKSWSSTEKISGPDMTRAIMKTLKREKDSDKSMRYDKLRDKLYDDYFGFDGSPDREFKKKFEKAIKKLEAKGKIKMNSKGIVKVVTSSDSGEGDEKPWKSGEGSDGGDDDDDDSKKDKDKQMSLAEMKDQESMDGMGKDKDEDEKKKESGGKGDDDDDDDNKKESGARGDDDDDDDNKKESGGKGDDDDDNKKESGARGDDDDDNNKKESGGDRDSGVVEVPISFQVAPDDGKMNSEDVAALEEALSILAEQVTDEIWGDDDSVVYDKDEPATVMGRPKEARKLLEIAVSLCFALFCWS